MKNKQKADPPRIKAVEMMREIRAKLDREYEGLTWEERTARMRARIAADPILSKWLDKRKTAPIAPSERPATRRGRAPRRRSVAR